MMKVTVKSIGPAEREIVRLLISDITVGDRNNALMARTIRRQFDLRDLAQTMDALAKSTRDEIIAALGDEPDPRIVSRIKQRAQGVSWVILLEEGYVSVDGEERYGDDYGVDKTTLEWLSNRRTEKTTWAWQVNQDGTLKLDDDEERIPAGVSPAMLDAIATLDEAIDKALKK